jgi:hypothetical protein
MKLVCIIECLVVVQKKYSNRENKMKVTVRMFEGSEVTGELVSKTENMTTIRVLEHHKGQRKTHSMGVWKSDRYILLCVPNESVISTENN